MISTSVAYRCAGERCTDNFISKNWKQIRPDETKQNTKREKPIRPNAININRNSSINFRQTPATSKFPCWPINSLSVPANVQHTRTSIAIPGHTVFALARWVRRVVLSFLYRSCCCLIHHRRILYCFDLFWCPLWWCRCRRRAYESDRSEYKYPVEHAVDTLVTAFVWRFFVARESAWIVSCTEIGFSVLCVERR